MRALRWICYLLLGVVLLVGAFWLWPSEPLRDGARADRIVVFKGDRRLELIAGGETLKSYRVALGSSPRAPKTQRGDGRTPEGRYVIDYRKWDSDFYRALHVSYPNAEDRRRARQFGVSPGGAIMIHGMKNGLGWIGRLHRFVDWTNGCIAVTNEEIEEIWRAVPNGTEIEIHP
ncbi:MAG: L,D-transpeptidase family protein [Methyloceanibacter sp.]|nr:L,D-transpeptidase family protein [Methyloceanibacter sp.]